MTTDRDVDLTSTVVALRPIATPLPVGLLGLTVGSTVLSGLQLHWFPVVQQHPAALCLIGFVVPLQFISFVFAVLGRDEGAASAMAVLAGSWSAIALVMLTGAPGSLSGALGVLLVTTGAVLSLPAVAAGGSKPLVALVLVLAGARFVLSGVYELTGATALEAASGVLGVVLATLAAYTAASFALEAAYDRTVLPTLRRAAAPRPGRRPRSPADHDSDAGVRPTL